MYQRKLKFSETKDTLHLFSIQNIATIIGIIQNFPDLRSLRQWQMRFAAQTPEAPVR